uniref:Uncharacterized protein n=1 Tax=Anopheles epiroticus TaxID=199890 RepID=A0A182PRG0_9DIPT
MSDNDGATRSAVPSPPLNCAKTGIASTPVDSEPLEKGENAAKDVKVTCDTEPTESKGASNKVLPLRPDDHEVIKGKQRKCVQFTTTAISPPPGSNADDTLLKFIEGEEILDKKNPFKFEEQCVLVDSVRDKHFPANATTIGNDDDGGNDANDADTDLDDDNVFITKEEILRQSKYVKTYIKNPDKQLNYDKSVIQKLNALKARGCQVRDVVVLEGTPSPPPVRPPIPAPRTIHRESDRNNNHNNNSRRQASPQVVVSRGGNPKPMPRARRDYAEVKVRIGSSEAEESLYDSNEVVQNALKFDSRFKKVEFGSQDDIDTIAERTEDDGSEQIDGQTEKQSESSPPIVTAKEANSSSSPSKKGQVEGRKSTFAEDVKKSFSNTVKSADFRKYLQSKGLSLVPAKPKAIENSTLQRSYSKPDSVISTAGSTPTTKPSVFTRLFQNSLFSPKTPNDPAYSSVFARSSTPVLLSAQQGGRLGRPQLPVRFGSFNGSLNRRSAVMADVKPKVNFKQLVEGNGETFTHPVVRRPASVNDFERPKLRTHFTNRSVSSVDSLKRPMRNAGVQVNLATGDGTHSQMLPTRQMMPVQQRPASWQLHGSGAPQHHAVTYQSIRQPPPAVSTRFYGGSTHTVAPLYSEPLREAPMMVQDEVDAGFRSTVDNGYHIYEQTPDNLRRSEIVYGKIGYHSNTQLNRWHPQDRRSYSSMQEGVPGMSNGGGTYGRLRPLYVSSPLSTQSTPVRRASDVIDREQILHRIYDFCRRSIRNSSKTSVHSNQTEPIYQRNATTGTTLAPSGSFPIERQRAVVQRVQSLNTPRPNATSQQYTRALVPVPATLVVNSHGKQIISAPRQNQHERNIENIYAFVNKKMVQMNVSGSGGADDRSVRSPYPSAPSTLRRVTFSSNGVAGRHGATDGLDEADYVNIRGAPDGKRMDVLHSYLWHYPSHEK